MASREELLATAQALQELEARKRVCPIAAYRPHPGQQTMHVSTVPTTLVCTGNRWGKTEALVADCIAAGLGYRPWEVENFSLVQDDNGTWRFPDRGEVPASSWVRRVDGLPIRVPGRFLLCTGLPLGRGIGEIIQPKFQALWPKQIPFKIYLGTLGVWQKIILPNGSEVYFGSAQQSQLAFEGANFDAAFFDEPSPKRVYTAVKRGLIDYNAWLKWTMTPLGDADMAWVAADLMREGREDVKLMRGTSWDNPYLDRDALARFLNDPTLSAAERKAREHGEVAALGQRIVTTFDEQCIVPPPSIPRHVPRVLVVDPHHSKPAAMIWAAVMGDGSDMTWVIYREWPTEDFSKQGVPRLTIHDLAGNIKTLEGKENIEWRFCDPQFGVQHAKVLGHTFKSFQEEMSEYDLHFDTQVDNDLDRGIQQLRDCFRIAPEVNKPRILVSNACENVIRSLNFWAYEGISDEGRLKPSEKYKDFADCVRYMIMAQYTFGFDQEWSYLDNDDDD